MEPTNKSDAITDLLEMMAGRTTAIKSNTCVRPPIGCGKPVIHFRDAQSQAEYLISGLCQECQDHIFGRGE